MKNDTAIQKQMSELLACDGPDQDIADVFVNLIKMLHRTLLRSRANQGKK